MFQELERIFGASKDYLGAAVAILAAVVAGFILQFFMLKLIRLISKKKGKTPDSIIVKHLRWPLRIAGPLAVIFALFECRRLPDWPKELTVTEKLVAPAQAVFITLFIFMFAWLAVKIISIAVEYIELRLKRTDAHSLRTRKLSTQIQIIKRISAVVIVFIATAVVLLQFKEISNLGTTLLVSTGVVGIIIGFAAQRSIATLLAGIQIAFSQPIRLDDLVVVENESGRIEEITLTYVVVRLWDLRRLILPITYFIEKPFQNWTRNSSDIVGSVFLFTDYAAPVADLRAKLESIVRGTTIWDGKTCLLQVTESDARGLTLRALVSAVDAARLWELRCLVREELVRHLADAHPECLPRLRTDAVSPPLPARRSKAAITRPDRPRRRQKDR